MAHPSSLRRVTTISVAVVGLVGLAIGAALVLSPAFGQSPSDHFTACLKGGTLSQVAVGDQPLQPCKNGEAEVSWTTSGSAGANGATWYSGVSLPNAALGHDGDLFLHLPSGDVFVKEIGTWVTKANLEGPQGPAGESGPPGPTGAPGQGGGSVTLVHDGSPHILTTSGNVVEFAWVTVAHADLPDGLYVDLGWQVDSLVFNPDEPSAGGYVTCRNSELEQFSTASDGDESEAPRWVGDDPMTVYELAGGTGITIECALPGFFPGGILGTATLEGVTLRISSVSS